MRFTLLHIIQKLVSIQLVSYDDINSNFAVRSNAHNVNLIAFINLYLHVVLCIQFTMDRLFFPVQCI